MDEKENLVGKTRGKFKAISNHLNCRYEDVLFAFCALDEDKKKKNQNIPFKRLEISAIIEWNFSFTPMNKKIRVSVSDYIEQIQVAHGAIKKLIPAFKHTHLTMLPDENWDPNLPSLSQLKNLKNQYKTLLDTIESDKNSFGPNAKPDADIIAQRLSVLFEILERPIKAGSNEGPPTSEFAKAIQFSFEVFEIDANPRTYSRKIAKRFE